MLKKKQTQRKTNIFSHLEKEESSVKNNSCIRSDKIQLLRNEDDFIKKKKHTSFVGARARKTERTENEPSAKHKGVQTDILD